MLVAKSDSSAVRTLDVGSLEAIDPVYRAPYCREIIFVGHPLGGTQLARPRMACTPSSPTAAGFSTIVAPTNLLMLGPRSSPYGTQIAYDAVRAYRRRVGTARPGARLRHPALLVECAP